MFAYRRSAPLPLRRPWYPPPAIMWAQVDPMGRYSDRDPSSQGAYGARADRLPAGQLWSPPYRSRTNRALHHHPSGLSGYQRLPDRSHGQRRRPHHRDPERMAGERRLRLPAAGKLQGPPVAGPTDPHQLFTPLDKHRDRWRRRRCLWWGWGCFLETDSVDMHGGLLVSWVTFRGPQYPMHVPIGHCRRRAGIGNARRPINGQAPARKMPRNRIRPNKWVQMTVSSPQKEKTTS